MSFGLLLALALFAADAGPSAVEPALPPRFAKVPGEAFGDSIALVPLIAGEAERSVVGVFAEPEEGGATLVVGRVERALDLDLAKRSVASSIAGHLRGELGLEGVVERPVVLDGEGGPRLEVRARVRSQAGERILRFAFVPAGGAHHVLAAAFPAPRAAGLDPALDQTFRSLGAREAAPPAARSTPLRLALFGLAGLAVAVLLSQLRRLRRQRA